MSRRIPDFKVIIAGTGEDVTRHNAVLESNPHFEMHDHFIPDSEVAAFFSRSALVVTPYTEASQSGIVATAFAFGKPVVTTNVGSLNEMVLNGKTGVVVSARSPAQFAEAIIYLLDNRKLRRKMGKAALSASNTIFGWQRIAFLTEKVYQDVLK